MTNETLIESLGSRGEKHLKSNLQADEKIIVKLKGHSSGFVLTDHRIYIVKWGWTTGSAFGGRCTAFDYANVVGLEIKKNLTTGILLVMSAATRDTDMSYWSTGSNNALRSNYAVTFQGGRHFKAFQEAVVIGRDLINQQHSGSAPTEKYSYSLEKLAELRDKGIITGDEFDAKKKQILGL